MCFPYIYVVKVVLLYCFFRTLTTQVYYTYQNVAIFDIRLFYVLLQEMTYVVL